MRARPVLIAFALASCTALAVASLAGARAPARTTVTIKGPNGDFSGKVFSPRGKCEANRKVTVYRLKGNGYDPANDPKIGSDVSERRGDHGEWSIGNTGQKSGRFYARAARKPGCRVAFSLPIKL